MPLVDIHPSSEHLASARATLRQLGFAELRGVVPAPALEALRTEAAAQRSKAQLAGAAGETAYRSRIAELGALGKAFVWAPATSRLLCDVLGSPFSPSEQVCCYTYYQSGDFLSRHLDRPDTCTATLILYLVARSPAPELPHTGLALRVFGSDGAEPMTVIPTRCGSLLLGRGTEVWHERPRLQPEEYVVALTACFRESSP